jgi:(p)ppGpp synthase/HD superfamily hydrolase
MGKLLDTAIKIAVDAHAGQYDRIGLPAIYHPMRVMMRIEIPENYSDLDIDILRATAILHDVLEDSDLSPDIIREILYKSSGYPYWTVNKVVSDVQMLTRTEDESYENYINRIKESSDNAINIKFADLFDNISRKDIPMKKDSLKKRYENALKILANK